MTGFKVGRLSRAFDLASFILVLIGGTLYLRAYFGMHQLRVREATPFERGKTELFASVNEFNRLHRLSNVGLAIAGAGIAVALSAAAHSHALRRRHVALPEAKG